MRRIAYIKAEMNKGRLATFALCGVILFLGYLFSIPKSLRRELTDAGFHPRLNSSRTTMVNPNTFEPISQEFEYGFDEIPLDRMVTFFEKHGYVTVHRTTQFPEIVRMRKPNRTHQWRTDESIELFGTPVDEHFPKQTTLLRLSHKL